MQKYAYPQNCRTESEKYVEAHISKIMTTKKKKKLTEVNTTEKRCTDTNVRALESFNEYAAL